MEKMLYSAIRKHIKVGDVIGCQGGGFISKAIRKLKGGEWSWSHVAIIIRDTQNEGTGRVSVLEAISNGGMQRNYLSKLYEASHGKLFWLKMNCSDTQKAGIMEMGAQIRERKAKYDFKSTFSAVFTHIFVDINKFNCSQSAWYLLTSVGRLIKRFSKGREIAPVPGDFPTWSGVEPVELDMG
jgi:hypothetical protein